MPKPEVCAALPDGAISDLVDGALTPFATWRVRYHVKRCAVCAAVFADERRLQSAARALCADAAPPDALREKAFAALPVTMPTPRRKAAFAAALVAAFMALTAGAIIVLTLVTQPIPAFAQIEKAMGEVRSARYVMRFTTFDIRQNKTRRFDLNVAVRFDLPAKRETFTSGVYEIETPEGGIRVWRSDKSPHKIRYAEWKPKRWSVYPGESADPATRFRQRLRDRIIPPEKDVNPESPRGAHWEAQEETVNGRRLLRYELSLGRRPAFWGDRLTQPSARTVFWADPETRRVARALEEYYDGDTHSRVFLEDFRYNETLPDALFSLTPPKNAVSTP